jgi:signal transduction histidine kinase
MTPDDKDASLEREQTDESLRLEREKTDRVLAEKRESIEEDADRVVEHARETADAVLLAAREKADERLEEAAPDHTPLAAVAEERIVEDETLREERESADGALAREREEDARLLRRLLPLEREKTDRYLMTERVRSDDAVANRDDFMSIVSHDLRDLLGGIAMSATLIAKRAGADAGGQKLVEETDRIQRYVARMNRLIGDLVDVASIDAGKLAVTPAPGDGAALVVEAVDAFQPAASAKGITLEAEIAARPLPARFDHDRVLQVFANLITNAIKFTPEGGTVTVRGERSGSDLRFCVSDTGAGIPDDMLEAVFERFRQLGGTDRGGLGLGLYISKCIVEAHGGSIRAEGKAGNGSRISFTLPG